MTNGLRPTQHLILLEPTINWNHGDVKAIANNVNVCCYGPCLLVYNECFPKQPFDDPRQQEKEVATLTSTILQRRNTSYPHISLRRPLYQGTQKILQVPILPTLNKPIQPGDKRPKDNTHSINDNCRSSTDHFHVTFPKRKTKY